MVLVVNWGGGEHRGTSSWKGNMVSNDDLTVSSYDRFVYLPFLVSVSWSS